MRLPKNEEVKIRGWLKEQVNKTKQWESDIRAKDDELADLITDLKMFDLLIDLIKDIDEESHQELVERAYQTEIVEERNEKVLKVQELEHEIKAIREKSKAIEILKEKFASSLES